MKYTPLTFEQLETILKNVKPYYEEAKRFYHTWEHTLRMNLILYSAFNEMESFDKQHLKIAIAFHDAIYDPQRTDNEEQSAALVDHLIPRDVKVDAKYIKDLVMSTKSHKPCNFGEDDNRYYVANLLIDADLSVLAAPEMEYRRYVRNVAREYSHLSEHDFGVGRLSFLKNLLARDRIFSVMRSLEAIARINMNKEVEQLQKSVRVSK